MKTIIRTTTFILLLASSAYSQDIPTAKEVKSVSIKFSLPKQDVPEFNCGTGAWDAIRSHLLPAKVDPEPSKWIAAGTVRITKMDGKEVNLELYSTPTGPGAFSIGGTYYRGGETRKLMEAIQAAFEISKKMTSEAPGSGYNLSYSSIWKIDGWDSKRLREAGITVKRVNPAGIAVWNDEEKDAQDANFVEITFDCSKLGEHQAVRMFLQVMGDNRKTLSAYHAERKKEDGGALKMVFFVDGSAIKSSYLQILIPQPSDKEAKPGNPGFSGYSLSLWRIMELASGEQSAKSIDDK